MSRTAIGQLRDRIELQPSVKRFVIADEEMVRRTTPRGHVDKSESTQQFPQVLRLPPFDQHVDFAAFGESIEIMPVARKAVAHVFTL